MTATKGSDNRVVLPRWRIWKDNQATGESRPLKGDRAMDANAIRASTETEFAQRLHEFYASRGVYEAADVVSAAIVLGLEEAQGARDAALTLYNSHLPIGHDLAERVLLQSSSPIARPELQPNIELDSSRSFVEEQMRVARLRRIVRRQPRDALHWLDLALAHTVLGNAAPARKAITIAISLSGDSRLVLRAAARFYVHERDLDAARAILSSDMERLLHDPWLLAADIAIADLADQAIRYGNRGKRMLESDLAPRHLSELAAALATAELDHGRMKQARKYFARV